MTIAGAPIVQPKHSLASGTRFMPRFALIALVVMAPALEAQSRPKTALDTAVFAGGCFWGIEGGFEHVKGVADVVSGYTGGRDASPTYDEVSGGGTGHAESVRVIYDPSVVSYGRLLQVFFSVAHDATELNRQGPDVGTQYRSAIFYRNDDQKKTAVDYIAQLTAAKYYRAPIVTEISPLGAFHLAESYHQDYMARHPGDLYIVMNDAPKVRRLKQGFPDLYREPK
jgi:peptide-methionine (S)-S-oxide reductase